MIKSTFLTARNERLPRLSFVAAFVFTSLLTIAGAVLSSPSSSAESVSVNAAVIVPTACTITSSIDSPHTAEIPAGQYRADIGTTTFNVICNDAEGFSIYAIGYSGNTHGNNKLLATIGGTLSPSNDINTGTNTSGSPSSWAVKLSPVAGSTSPSIVNGYGSYSNVPAANTKVVTYAAATNPTSGSSFKATYAANIAGTQPAGNYEGKVKYTFVHPASEVPLEPQTTASGKICYYANASDAVGTMGCQNVASSVTLLASNFSRNGYGFAGWSDAYDYASNSNANFYGPSETITLTPADYQSPNKGLSLYAVWVKSNGSLQGWTGCPAMSQGDVTALTDTRDNQTYAVAKLADGKCWMIENLRLESTNSDNSTGALAQGYGGQFAGLADAEPAWANNSTTANSLYSTDGSSGTINIGTSTAGYRFPRYNHDNTNSRASSPTANSAAMYSYGNYYTWHAAIADITAYSTNNQSVTNTSLCPAGWHLPKGGNKSNEANNEFWSLAVTGVNGGVVPANYNSSTTPYYTGTAEAGPVANKLRSYPNNFVYSGYVNSGSVGSRGSYGSFWSSTAYSSSLAYTLGLNSSVVAPGTVVDYKYYGWTVRCVADVSQNNI